MAKVRMAEDRLRQILKARIENCSPEALIDAAGNLLAADLSRECVCGSFIGDIPNRELARDEGLAQFIQETSFDDSVLRVAREIDVNLPLSQYRVELRLALVRQGVKFDEDVMMAICNKLRNEGS
ncbi:hypothetical protein [Vibrio owensii]|uniref:hypothetical protein n=1 Tax=Vibrio owensii TaxID=696485 RepID=UPI0018F19A5C|nr:hypothetical protein [Vibrio owensii]